jgi:hypothetical protein
MTVLFDESISFKNRDRKIRLRSRAACFSPFVTLDASAHFKVIGGLIRFSFKLGAIIRTKIFRFFQRLKFLMFFMTAPGSKVVKILLR